MRRRPGMPALLRLRSSRMRPPRTTVWLSAVVRVVLALRTVKLGLPDNCRGGGIHVADFLGDIQGYQTIGIDLGLHREDDAGAAVLHRGGLEKRWSD